MGARIEQYQQLIRLDPADPILYFGLGQACVETGHDGKACEAYQKAIALKPDYTAAYLPLAKVLERLGRLDEAIQTYQQGITVGEQTQDAIPLQKMKARLRRLTKR